MSSSLLIVAAGKGKRMGDIDVPKALYNINGKPNIEWMLDSAESHFNDITIICSNDAVNQFKYLKNDKVTIRGVQSGLGDGRAILEAFNIDRVNKYLFRDTVIAWGDLYCPNDLLFKELKNVELGDSRLIIPVALEEDPYVHFHFHECGIYDVGFSKFGNSVRMGWHDQSMFKCDIYEMYKILENMHIATWQNDKYNTRNGELNLLNSVHYLLNIGFPAIAHKTEIVMSSFNTQEEANSIVH